ncbi:MAG TPA: ABC transporter substrate-binding protein [Acholeplasmatales bacterium]|nr:ABC transporter substrate-binding protein [Acholeplasmatales bacterium]
MARKIKIQAKNVKRIIWLLLAVILVTFLTTVIVQSFNPNHYLSQSQAPDVLIPGGDYEDFLKLKQGIPADALDNYPLDFAKLPLPQLDSDIIIDGTAAVSNHADGFETVNITDQNGQTVSAYKTTDEGLATWTIPGVPTAGLYRIYLNYFPISDGGASIERGVYINQSIDPVDPDAQYEHQYADLENVKFSRYWTDAGDIIRDTTDNDMKPSQTEILDVQRTAFLRDETGYILEPYLFYLQAGDNTITLESIRESMAIVSIGVTSYSEQITYEDYRAEYAALGYSEVAELSDDIHIEGEDASERTSPTLYAIGDRTDPLNNPIDIVKIRLNAIGGSKWTSPGDAITWEVDMTNQESGLYYLSFRSKQNVSRGLFSTRRVYVNGAIPFAEANGARFSYSSDFQIVTLGDDAEPYAFYLEGGQVNTISLESTLGEYGVPISEVQGVIDQLNDLYLRIIAVTSLSPDPLINYYLYGENARVEGTLETFEACADILEEVGKSITAISGEKSDKTAILDTMRYQLRDLVEKPRTIQEKLTTFSKNLSSLGTWISDVKEQALTIECLWVHDSMDDLPQASSNFFSGTWFGIRSFFKSFFFDYEAIGTIATVDTGKDIEVWFLTSESTGREQANSISTLISNTFTEQYGINVKLKVVTAGVLLPSTLAGTGPDIAINVANGLPVNYAMRNAIMDVSGFEEFYEVTGICTAANAEAGNCTAAYPNDQYQFMDSAMVPYEFDGGYYALPNTQSFLVMFVRHDIFEARGWTVPETWREVTSLVTELSISNLQFYLPVTASGASSVVNQVFASMLYQRGGTFYRNNNSQSNFDTEEAMQAFEEWCKYYTDYSFPLAASFLNRFRTGETPIGIASYELFNTLTVFAPEIAGKWSYAPLPGTYDEFGVLNNSGAASGSSIVMMKNTEDPESAWDFMRWWVSKDTQTSYARELESILGAAARHNTANVLAFQNLPWTREEQDILISQWENSVGVPEVPGGYYTGRNLENAFREVVNNDTNPRETLSEYVALINAEITKKREEFGLE